MTINIFMHIYIGKNAHWDRYTPPPLQIITQKKFFSHFRCILLQISHKHCFFYKYFYTRAFRGYKKLLWMKTMHYPNTIRSHLVTLVPMALFTPKSTSKLRSALHISYSIVIRCFIFRANTAQS